MDGAGFDEVDSDPLTSPKDPAHSHALAAQVGQAGFGDRWRSHLPITLMVTGEVQGMILLMSEKADQFGPEQFGFFRTLGQQIGVATQNARLFQQVQQSHTRMKALSLRLVEVQEAERRYVARELHDEIGQVLTGLKLALEMDSLLAEGEAKARFEEAMAIVNRLVVLVRELSLNLRPAMLDDLGLLPTLPWHFKRFSKQTNIGVTFKHSGLNEKRFPLEAETAIYRIIQEALTNVARHARVQEVIVRLWCDGKALGVQIEDTGTGFDAEAVMNGNNTSGLGNMRERAVLLGGHFSIETAPGAGTRLTAELPIETEQGWRDHGNDQDSPR